MSDSEQPRPSRQSEPQRWIAALDPWPIDVALAPPTMIPAGRTLFRSGDVVSELRYIVTGVVMGVVSTPDGRE